MTVTVLPDEFHVVAFDRALIERIAAETLTAVGLADHDLRIEVDERSLLGRSETEFGERGIVVRVGSGAFEDTRRPRRQSETGTRLNLGRVLLRTADRIHGGFADAPADDDLSLADAAAWETYCVGRLSRMGIPVFEPRWRYNFRNRHGFSDAADATFDRLWSADGLTWAELSSVTAAC